MLAEGNLLDAERLLRSFLQRHERHVAALRRAVRLLLNDRDALHRRLEAAIRLNLYELWTQ
jgi:hypothetical protein